VESDDKVLIDSLSRHQQLKVRLLISDDAHMSDEARNRTTATVKQVDAARQQFGDRVELRRFEDEGRHSFVIADNDMVAGPVFEDDKSRHDPAVHVAAETLFGQKYSTHFERMWNSANAGP
jgi:hypothetical protein